MHPTGRRLTARTGSGFSGYRFPDAVIALAVRWYHAESMAVDIFGIFGTYSTVPVVGFAGSLALAQNSKRTANARSRRPLIQLLAGGGHTAYHASSYARPVCLFAGSRGDQ